MTFFLVDDSLARSLFLHRETYNCPIKNSQWYTCFFLSFTFIFFNIENRNEILKKLEYEITIIELEILGNYFLLEGWWNTFDSVHYSK